MVCITVMHTYNNALLYFWDILIKLYRGTTILNLDDQNLFSGTKHYSHFHKHFSHFHKKIFLAFCARLTIKFSKSSLTYKKISSKIRL